ncbi:MAG: hypothetical protein KGH58_03480 [Candidatus Micrarchaeota archaeon]|nr:hypothetical protein [Candidatus Micrarchaeota archaeon]
MAGKARQVEVLHSPRLSTVIMVEQTLKDFGGVIKVAELKRRLPRKVMHSTLLGILDYLQKSGKIVIGTKGVLWVYAPKAELDRLTKGGLEV